MNLPLRLIAALVLTSIVNGAEQPLVWPQFRGPGGSGIAEDQKPPVEVGPDKNLKWKVPAPSGLSSPIIASDKLIITALENEKLYTIAYDRADGSEAWRAEAPAQALEAYHKTEGSPAARHAQRTASASFRISVHAVCFVTTCLARSFGSSRCRRPQFWETSAAESRP